MTRLEDLRIELKKRTTAIRAIRKLMKDRAKLTHQEKAELFDTYIVPLAKEYVKNKISDGPTHDINVTALSKVLIAAYGNTIYGLLEDI